MKTPTRHPSLSRRSALQLGSVVLLLGVQHIARGATIVAVRVWPSKDYTRLTIESDGEIKARQVADAQKAAVAEAEATRRKEQQYQNALAKSNAGQLFALAEQSVAAGDADKAREARLALISRFPNHPLAATEGKWKGHVAYPKINMNEQFVDALEASRAYEANIGVMEVTKNISRQNLSILA